MHEHGKSDSPVVPASSPNKAAAAEAGEERGLAKGNTAGKTRPGHWAGHGALSALDRVRQAARRDKEARFTALLHHVSLERLVMAYWALSPKAAPGVDGVTWAGLRAGPGGQPPGPARPGSQRALPGKAVAAGVHPEGGRAAAAARHHRAGRQDHPAGRRRGAQRHLRGGLPGFLLRVPAGARPASGAGCAGDRDRAEEGELGARRGHPRLLGSMVILLLC